MFIFPNKNYKNIYRNLLIYLKTYNIKYFMLLRHLLNYNMFLHINDFNFQVFELYYMMEIIILCLTFQVNKYH